MVMAVLHCSDERDSVLETLQMPIREVTVIETVIETFIFLIFNGKIIQFCNTSYTIHCSTKIQQPFFKYQAAVLSAEAWKSICFFIFVLYKMAQDECIYKCCKNTKELLWCVKWPPYEDSFVC